MYMYMYMWCGLCVLLCSCPCGSLVGLVSLMLCIPDASDVQYEGKWLQQTVMAFKSLLYAKLLQADSFDIIISFLQSHAHTLYSPVCVQVQ